VNELCTFSDEHDDGQLSAFRERLSAEVRAQTGRMRRYRNSAGPRLCQNKIQEGNAIDCL
jgi:hypothetical protein